MNRRPHGWLAALAALGGVLLFAAAAGSEGHAAPPAVVPDIHEVRVALTYPGSDEVVEVSAFALDDGRALDEQEAAARAAILARFPGAVEVPPAEVSAQFQIFGIRWREPRAEWVYNAAGATDSLSASAAFSIILAGAEGWRGAGGTAWQFDYAGWSSTPIGCNGIPESIPRDGANVVGWGTIAGGYLGFSCWWRSASLVQGTPYFEALEFDIVFDPDFEYTADTLEALALHEFGHALGLDHTEDSLCPGSAMCAGADAMIYEEPQEDDLFGLIALYGFAPTPAATASPTQVATATPTAPLPDLLRRSTFPLLSRD